METYFKRLLPTTDRCTLGGPFSVTFSNAYMLNLENNQNVVDTQSLLSVDCFCNPNLRVEPFYCVLNGSFLIRFRNYCLVNANLCCQL